jgi:uncharacterized protein YndB with AHSA1/START domain
VVRNLSQIRINAPLSRVWQTLTLPDQVKHWQYGSELVTSWAVGEPIRFRTVWNDTVFEQWGTVLEFRPQEQIRYTLFAPRPNLEDRPDNYFIMTYRLTPNDGAIDLEIIQEDPRPGAVQEPAQGEENPILAELKRVAEQ